MKILMFTGKKFKIIFCFLVLSNISTCIFYLFVLGFFSGFFFWGGIIHMMANSYKLGTSFPEYFPPTTLTPAVTATAIPRHTTTINKRNRLFKSTIYNENELIPYNRTLNGHNPGNDSYSDGQQLEIRCSGAIVRICTWNKGMILEGFGACLWCHFLSFTSTTQLKKILGILSFC